MFVWFILLRNVVILKHLMFIKTEKFEVRKLIYFLIKLETGKIYYFLVDL